MPGPAPWKLSDYVDILSALRVGQQARALDNSERASQAMNARQDQQLQMQQADALTRMGVDPVMSDGGGIDWQATGQLARKQNELKQSAATLGELHGAIGGPTVMTQEEMALSQLPEYKNAYRRGTIARETRQIAQEAALEQQTLRNQGSLDVAKQRSSGAGMATVKRTMPDGSVVEYEVPQDQIPAMGNLESESPGTQKYQDAIDAIRRFQSQGTPIDIEFDSQGYPKITKSLLNHDASKKVPGSYDKAIQKIIDMESAQTGSRRNLGVPGGQISTGTNAPDRKIRIKFP